MSLYIFIMTYNIEIAGKKISAEPGLVSVADLCAQAEVQVKNSLLLEREDGKILLEEKDFLIIHSDVKIVAADSKKPGSGDDKSNAHCPVSCTFNGQSEEIDQIKMLGKELREKDTELDSSKLYAVIDGSSIDAYVEDDFRIVIQGGEKFITIPDDAENGGVIDVEKCAKLKHFSPKGYKYSIRIDGERKEVVETEMTGEAILALVGKTPQEHYLNRKFPGAKRERIEATIVVNLVDGCTERFTTTPKNIDQGDKSFDLPEEDREYLDTLEKEWRTEQDAGDRLVVILDYDLPDGYDHQVVELMIKIPPNYPMTKLDMFYLNPPIHRKDGREIPKLSLEMVGERQWQQWSRHYKDEEWHPDIGLAGYLDSVKDCLQEAVS